MLTFTREPIAAAEVKHDRRIARQSELVACDFLTREQHCHSTKPYKQALHRIRTSAGLHQLHSSELFLVAGSPIRGVLVAEHGQQHRHLLGHLLLLRAV